MIATDDNSRMRFVSEGSTNYIQSVLDATTDSYRPLHFTSMNGGRTFLKVLDTGIDVTGDITVSGNVDGIDIATQDAKLETMYTTIGLSALTSGEVDQLENIGTTTISPSTWGYLGGVDQNVHSGANSTFNDITVLGTVDGIDIATQDAKLETLYTTIGLSALTSGEVDQLENIGATTISATQWGFLGAMDQDVNVNGNVEFNSAIIDSTGTEAFLVRKDSDGGDVFVVNTTDRSSRFQTGTNNNMFIVDDTNGVSVVGHDNGSLGGTYRDLSFTGHIIKLSVGSGSAQTALKIDSNGSQGTSTIITLDTLSTVIDGTGTEALLVRKGTDGGDVFVVDTTNSVVAVTGDITVSGNVDGIDIATQDAKLETMYTTIGLSSLTSGEVDQLENIGTTTISATQWGYLGATDQSLATTDAVQFNSAIIGSVSVDTTTTVGTTVNPSSSTGGALNVGGDLVLGTTTPRIYFPNNGVAAPTFTNRSAGTKIILSPAIDSSNSDYAFGIDSSVLWCSVPSTSREFKWFGGTTEAMNLTGSGTLSVQGNIVTESDLYANGIFYAKGGNSYFYNEDNVNSGSVNMYFSNAGPSNQVKSAIISESVGDWGRSNLHICKNSSSDSTDVSLTDKVISIYTDRSIEFHERAIIDTTGTDAFVVRKDSGGGDVFTVDTTNSSVAIGGSMTLLSNFSMIATDDNSRLRFVSVGSTNYIQSALDATTDSYRPLHFTSMNGGRTFLKVLDTGIDVTGDITVSGNVDGIDIATQDAKLETMYTTIGLSSLTSGEVDQLENIGATTISATQWGFLGAMDQDVNVNGNVEFNSAIIDSTGTEAFVVRKDSDGGDVFKVDTTNLSVAITGSLTISSGFSALAANIQVYGVTATNPSQSTTTTSGGITCLGGIGIGKNATIGGILTVSGTVIAPLIQSNSGNISVTTSGVVLTSFRSKSGFITISWGNGTRLYFFDWKEGINAAWITSLANTSVYHDVTLSLNYNSPDIEIVATSTTTVQVYWYVTYSGSF
jgi:hypothetical protein